MKFLHVVPSYLPAYRYGGTIYAVHGLCKALVEAGHEVHVYTTNIDGDKSLDVRTSTPVNIDGVQVWYFPASGIRRLFMAPDMKRALSKNMRSFSVVHLHSVFLWPTWVAARIAFREAIPYVLSPHGMLVKELFRRKSRWIKTLWYRLIEKKTLNQATGLHLTSEQEYRDLLKFYKKTSRVFTIPNGVEQPTDYSERGVSRDVRKAQSLGPYVLYLGRINWKKGLNELINVWQEVPQARLIIAGNDEEGLASVLERQVEDKQLKARISILGGRVDGADKESLIKNARLFVLPSISENFGITVIEAMARSVPVIVTPEVGAAGAVEESDGGIISSLDQMAGSVSKVWKDHMKLSTMGRNGKQYVQMKLSWETVADKMIRKYQEIIAEARA